VSSDLKDLGPGVTIYFKYVKYLMILFLVMAVITIPHIVLYVAGGTKDYTDSRSITSFFALTTMGNLGSSYKMCNSGSDFSSSISLYCSSGTIDSIFKFGEGKSDDSSSCKNNGEDLKVDDS